MLNDKTALIRFATGILLAWLASGCATTQVQTQPDPRPRFREGDRADVVLRFNRWDTIHLLRPDSRAGGFLPILTRASLAEELQSRRVNQNLAVVLLGQLLPGPVETQTAGEWVAFLSGLGFKRTVVLRSGFGDAIDGLLVVRDSAIAAAHDDASPAAPLAALAPAARADAAHPSSH